MTSMKGLLSRLHMLQRTVADAWQQRHELVCLSDYGNAARLKLTGWPAMSACNRPSE